MEEPRQGKKSQGSASGAASGSDAWMLARHDEVKTFSKEKRAKMGAAVRKKRKEWGVDGERAVNLDAFLRTVQGELQELLGSRDCGFMVYDPSQKRFTYPSRTETMLLSNRRRPNGNRVWVSSDLSSE